MAIPLGKSSANAAPVLTSTEPTDSPTTSAAPRQSSPSISRLLSRRIQQDLAQRLNVAPSAIAIVESTPKTWTDQCLGLARSNERCWDGEVHGWQVQVKSAQQQWVYRSDRPQTQPRNGSAPPTRTVIRKLSPSAVEDFQNLLKQQHFPNLNNVNYLTEVAVSDYPLTQFQVLGTKVGYIDLEAENLPPDLRRIIAGWQKLAR